jgi:hypothetical protein
MRDSPRPARLNSITQARTPRGKLFCLATDLILDRVSGILRSAFFMILIARIVFLFGYTSVLPFGAVKLGDALDRNLHVT